MQEKLRLIIQESKLHLYQMLFGYYRCKTLRHDYNERKMREYTDKICHAEAEFKELTKEKS